MIAMITAALVTAAPPPGTPPEGRPPANQQECQVVADEIFAESPFATDGDGVAYEAHYASSTGRCYGLIRLQVVKRGVVREHAVLAMEVGVGEVGELHVVGTRVDACRVQDQPCADEEAFNARLQQLIDPEASAAGK